MGQEISARALAFSPDSQSSRIHPIRVQAPAVGDYGIVRRNTDAPESCERMRAGIGAAEMVAF